MKITRENVTAHELIGLQAKVIESLDPSINNLTGRIVYETKNMLVLKVDGEKTKMIPKKIIKLLLTLPESIECVVNGSDMVGRPEDRIQRFI